MKIIPYLIKLEVPTSNERLASQIPLLQHQMGKNSMSGHEISGELLKLSHPNCSSISYHIILGIHPTKFTKSLQKSV